MEPQNDIVSVFMCYCAVIVVVKVVKRFPVLTLMSPAPFYAFSSRCAGVCSYEGRGGLCSIRLSEPLLKLRPRKDLVEVK